MSRALISSEDSNVLGVMPWILFGDYRYSVGIFKGQTENEEIISMVRFLRVSKCPHADSECVPVSEFPVELVEAVKKEFPGLREPNTDEENREYATRYLL